VFITPPLPALQRDTFQEALATCIDLTGKGLSQQAYALRTKILEAAAVANASDVVFEVHPEVSFRAMAHRPLAWPKTTWSGMWDRLDLLAQEGISLPHMPGPAAVVAVDDLIDAAAAAWSAARWAARAAQSVAAIEISDSGRRIGIWY
jgi:predicted RNase H-like nuclease